MAVKGGVEAEARAQGEDQIRLAGQPAGDPVAARPALPSGQWVTVAHHVGVAGGGLGELEGDRSEMVRLAYLDGLSRQEVADRFAQPVGTIKTWLRRSLQQLQDCMDR